MFSARNIDSPNPFRPALQYLLSSKPRYKSRRRKSSSSGSLDSETDSGMFSSNSRLGADSRNLNSIPLINISRSPSPFQRRNSGPNLVSDSDDDDWGDRASSRHPFLPHEPRKLTGLQALLYGGGFGQFIFTTQIGWQLYIAVLVLWLGGCEIGVILINRIILWSAYLKENYTSHTKLMPMIAGVYKFPYPLTTTFLEMLIAHFFVVLSAYITRLASPWLISAGLSGMIAPSYPVQSSTSPGFRRAGKGNGGWGSVSRWTASFSGGVSGGGIFELDLQVARQVLPVAIIFVAQVALSNLSFAYAQLPIYILARIGIVPISLILTALFTRTPPSTTAISSALTATLTLLVSTTRSNVRVTWESIVAGVLSSFFVALYPVQLSRTYNNLVASLVPQGDLLTSVSSNGSLPPDHSGSKEEARAYWRLLHYTSLLSILIFFPIVIFSGEIGNISRNCYFLDVLFHWLMVLCGGLGSWAIFWATIALTKATSPLTTSFLFVPRSAFLLPVMAEFKMPAYAWIGILMCWASCAWFLNGRRKEGRMLGGLR